MAVGVEETVLKWKAHYFSLLGTKRTKSKGQKVKVEYPLLILNLFYGTEYTTQNDLENLKTF